MVVAARNLQQLSYLMAVVAAVVAVPAANQPHGSCNHQAKAGDGTIGRHAPHGGQAVQQTQTQNAGLFIEVLYGNRAAGTHEAVATVLQQCVHGYDQIAAQTAEHDQKWHGNPQVADEVHADHQQAHGNAHGNHARGVLQAHAHGGQHGAHGRANRDHAHQRRSLRGAVAQGHGSPGQHDVAQIAGYAPEQGGGGQ